MTGPVTERALPFVLVGEQEAEESWEDWKRREGREKSVGDEKAWLNQPERRVGRSPMRVRWGGGRVVTDV
jgi:hypothetical protein